jgi:uncharacterized membrane-anchored protein YjiN (DUF445 family)
LSLSAQREDTTRRTAEAQNDGKAAGLTRMRRVASCLLVFMMALLLACVVLQRVHAWLAWPRAFAEAGLAGAIADWYAVIALFRRPLGLRIPHTAIIPQNQQRIAESLGNFVEENFLTPELIVGRLGEHNAARSLARWLVRPANSRGVAAIVANSVAGLLDGMDEADVAWLFERLVIPQLRVFDLTRVAGAALAILTEGGRHQPLLDEGLKALEQWLTANSDMIKARFSEASRYTPASVDAWIVKKFIAGVIAMLHETAADPDHELRRRFDAALQELIVRLRTSPVHRRFARSLMRDFIRHVRRADRYEAMLERFRSSVRADLAGDPSAVRDTLTAMLASLGRRVAREPEIQDRLNAWWLTLAHELVARYRRELSALITEVVRNWDADEVGRKIEAEIGRDLQYVRINGAFVGGMVGVALHAVTLAFAH